MYNNAFDKGLLDHLLYSFTVNKDAFTILGVMLTILLSGLSLVFTTRNNKAVYYVNSITKNRVDWMYKFKEYLAEFIRLTSSHEFKNYICDPEKISDQFDELTRLVFLINIHLNFKGEIDSKIIALIEEITRNHHIRYFYVKYAYSPNTQDALRNINKRLGNGEEVSDDELNEIFDRQEEMLSEIENNPYIKDYVETRIFTSDQSFEMIASDYPLQLNVYYKVLSYGLQMDSITKKLFDDLRKEVKIYLKFEWNRIKIEAQGRHYFKWQQKRDLMALYDAWDNSDGHSRAYFPPTDTTDWDKQ